MDCADCGTPMQDGEIENWKRYCVECVLKHIDERPIDCDCERCRIIRDA